MKLDAQELPHVVIGSCMEVHRHLGQGLDAFAYKACLSHELRMREIVHQVDVPLPVRYKGHELPSAATLDFVIEGIIILSVKAVDDLLPVHKETLKNYLVLSGIETGLLVNFNAPHLRSNGVKRIIVSSSEPKLPFKTSPPPVPARTED
jgi:GxxExxY protein